MKGNFLLVFLFLILFVFAGCKDKNNVAKEGILTKDVISTSKGNLEIIPMSHASLILKANGKTIYVDTVGDVKAYSTFSKPDLIIITHTHPDHLNLDLIKAVKKDSTIIAGPKSVADALEVMPITLMDNGDVKTLDGFEITAVPMYNTTEDRLKFHPKGWGSGFVIQVNDKKVYIAGDTEDIPEMKALKDIDVAFIPLNLPFTMTEEQAASAVLAFQPKIVYPYHYRGKPNMSDIHKFKNLIVSKNDKIEVRFLKWY